jgi:hypothetical protein
MSNTVELLAILLSGLFAPRRRESTVAGDVAPSNDVFRSSGSESPPHARPTIRLLRLVGARRELTSDTEQN